MACGDVSSPSDSSKNSIASAIHPRTPPSVPGPMSSQLRLPMLSMDTGAPITVKSTLSSVEEKYVAYDRTSLVPKSDCS